MYFFDQWREAATFRSTTVLTLSLGSTQLPLNCGKATEARKLTDQEYVELYCLSSIRLQ